MSADDPLYHTGLIQQLLATPEFSAEATFTRPVVVTAYIRNERLRAAIADYLLDREIDPATVEFKRDQLGTIGIHYLDAPGTADPLQQEDIASFVRYHLLGQRLAEAMGVVTVHGNFPPAYLMADADSFEGFNVVDAGPMASELCGILVTMLPRHEKIAQYGEVNDAASQHLPKDRRPYLRLSDDAVRYLNGMNDRDFFTAFKHAQATQPAGIKRA